MADISATKASAASRQRSAKGLTVLVTVGSTLFPALTNHILSPSILSLLPQLGVGRLVVQYGRADLLALTDIEDIEVDAQGNGQFTWVDYNGLGQVQVEVLRYTNDLKRLIEQSDAVISHAGSGSILDVIRIRPLLVVPNTSLMDNHQVQLAEALDAQGYLISSSVDDLEDNLRLLLNNARRSEVKPFPEQDKERFRLLLDQTMGFED